jgi:hypothetical protein
MAGLLAKGMYYKNVTIIMTVPCAINNASSSISLALALLGSQGTLQIEVYLMNVNHNCSVTELTVQATGLRIESKWSSTSGRLQSCL